MSGRPHIEFISRYWYGVFHFDAVDAQGAAVERKRRVSLGIKEKENRRRTEKEFEHMKRDVILQERSLSGPASSQRTVANVIGVYLSSAALSVRRRTLNIYTQALHHFGNMYSSMNAPELTALHIERYKEALRGRYAPVTVNMYLRAVKTMLAYAVRTRLLLQTLLNRCANTVLNRKCSRRISRWINFKK